MAYCFISDLHLHEGRQDLKRAFFSFLEEKVTKADKLYILGDLFETWIGDDDNSPFVAEVIDALQRLIIQQKFFSCMGIEIFF